MTKHGWLQFTELQIAVLTLRLFPVVAMGLRGFCQTLITTLSQMLFQKELNLLGLVTSPHFRWLFLLKPVLLLGRALH